VAIAAEKQLRELPLEVTTVGNPRVTREVRAITDFGNEFTLKKVEFPY
jgi:type I restriction enzyme S subunit